MAFGNMALKPEKFAFKLCLDSFLAVVDKKISGTRKNQNLIGHNIYPPSANTSVCVYLLRTERSNSLIY